MQELRFAAVLVRDVFLAALLCVRVFYNNLRYGPPLGVTMKKMRPSEDERTQATTDRTTPTRNAIYFITNKLLVRKIIIFVTGFASGLRSWGW